MPSASRRKSLTCTLGPPSASRRRLRQASHAAPRCRSMPNATAREGSAALGASSGPNSSMGRSFVGCPLRVATGPDRAAALEARRTQRGAHARDSPPGARSAASRARVGGSRCGEVRRADTSSPARRADLARGDGLRSLVPDARAEPTGCPGRASIEEGVRDRTRTSTARCATADRRGRGPGSQWVAEHAATGTPRGRLPRSHPELQRPGPP